MAPFTQENRRLRIATTPPGAQLRVDGADVGRSPVEVEVTRGQHVVIARASQHLNRRQQDSL